MKITSKSAFIKYVKELYLNQNNKIHKFARKENYNVEIDKLNFIGVELSYFHIFSVRLIECTFINCTFDSFEFNGVELVNCRFDKCNFQKTVFMDCSLLNCSIVRSFTNAIYFGMSSLEDVNVTEGEFQFVDFSDCLLKKINFNNCSVINGKFESGDFYYAHKSEIGFNNTSLTSVHFIDLDLTLSVFQKCELSISIINSIISTRTISDSKSVFKSNIDLSTILKSEALPEKVLKNNFGITDRKIKGTIEYLTSEPEYHSVFISYSFKDSEFANQIMVHLKKKSITAFLWAKDAPGGKEIKRIMSDNIRKHERFLFIASKNSLKSEACHYEIRKARKKFYSIWGEFFVPIHLDNFLFETLNN